MRPWLLFLCLVLAPLAGASPPFILDSDTIDVTTHFRGTHMELTTFVETPDPQVGLVIVGPPATLTFRRKERRAGLWVNAQRQDLLEVASYVALIGYDELDLTQACLTNTLGNLAHEAAANLSWVCNASQRALMSEKGLFVLRPTEGLVDLGQGFHSASAFLPPTAKPGSYDLRFWVDQTSAQTEITVRRAGLERWVLTTAQNHRLVYGLLCLILAALAGYVTNLFFSRRS